MSENVPTAAILSIGDEVLRGDTVDTNQAFLGTELTRRGVEVRLAVTVPDELETIVAWVRKLAAEHDHVFSFGGIGSTPDDVTRPAMARAFDRELVLYAEQMNEYLARRGRLQIPAFEAMWMMPADSELLWGERVTIPGFRVDNVYVFPGVPQIMKLMWEQIAGRFNGAPQCCVRFTSRIAESRYTPIMAEFIQRYPAVKFGSYPRLGADGKWSVELALHGTDEDELRRVAGEFQAAIEALGPNPW